MVRLSDALRNIGVVVVTVALSMGCQILGGFEDHQLEDGAGGSGASGGGGDGTAGDGSGASSSGGAGTSGGSVGGDGGDGGGGAGDGCMPACDPDETCEDGMCVGCTGVLCGGNCIDPDTDNDYCGASADCMGPDAGEQCSPSATCAGGGCVDSCLNCSFETGGFTSWMIQDLTNPYEALSVVQAGFSNGYFATSPTDGSWSAINGFAGDGPGIIEIATTVTLRDLPMIELVFDYRSGWSISGAAREFSVVVEDNSSPATLTEVLLVASGSNSDTGPMTDSIDVSQFGGSDVTLRFRWSVPGDFTGPAFFELDNIRFQAP